MLRLQDKNWEKQQARAALEQRGKMNAEAKGSWFANLLPKLGAVSLWKAIYMRMDAVACMSALYCTIYTQNPHDIMALNDQHRRHVYVHSHA
jgi:hypothetical protein